MNNFIYRIPTKIVFGRDAEKNISEEAKPYGTRALILYGSERIRRSGVFDGIAEGLNQAGITWYAFGGITENASLTKVREAIAVARQEDIDLLIAVGGGSVIDTAKAVSLGACYDGDVWNLYEQKAVAPGALPLGVVLTMAATASEANCVSVIWNEETNVKQMLAEERTFPKFSLLNPELTYTVPARQTAAGSLDIFAHAFERYMVKEQSNILRDQLCRAVMKTVTTDLPKVIQNGNCYDTRSQLMWAATMAHSDMIGFEGDFACHELSHVFTEQFHLAHGEALAIIMPAWCAMMSQREPDEMEKFFVDVWDATGETQNARIETGLQKFYNFVRENALAATLEEAGLETVDPDQLTSLVFRGGREFIGGGFQKLYRQDVKELIERCK